MFDKSPIYKYIAGCGLSPPETVFEVSKNNPLGVVAS